MHTNIAFAVLLIITLFLSACQPISTPIPTPYIIPISGSIGQISVEETLVESGPIDKLVRVTKTKEFFNNETVRVTNGGVARLDFVVNQISIRLFNDTAVDDVKADVSGTANTYIRMKLVFGGLSGEVTKNGTPVQFDITNGVTIYVLGTQFLVLYDPESGTTYIANFDGTIAYSLPGLPVQFTQAGQLYEISHTFEVRHTTLAFTRAAIEDFTSSRRSTLLDSLRHYVEPTTTPTPTLTPTATITPSPTPSATITPSPTRFIPCNKAAFVSDVTVPDGTSFSPGFQFAKVWRLKNVGTCTWTTSYSFVFHAGDQMSAPAAVSIPSAVAPGQSVDITVGMVAPALAGSYRGDWMLMSSSGASFGAGANGTTPIWVQINVITTGTITGIAFSDLNDNGIRDSDEQVVQGMTVTLKNPPGTLIGTTITDANGRYTFSNLNTNIDNLYYVRINGCTRQNNVQVTLNIGDTKTQDFAVISGCG